ncbi:leucine-rich repeat-containing protein 71-like [Achroia grisella]|uniref:leucine-rich repeat-containing protein 71-like n=1 Tax=Achroia grisella TaxID=688607 RepID=UPI0027D32334|nr:leucine-rich repeat-containing protein 71-like [Achroia grisella]
MKVSRMGTVKSVRSVRSMRSVKSVHSVSDDDIKENFETYLPLICRKFPKEIPYPVIVKKEYQRDGFFQSLKQEETVKYKKISVKHPVLSSKVSTRVDLEKLDEKLINDTSTEIDLLADENAILIIAFYDNMKRLTEIVLHKTKVPRALIQIISYLAPSYEQLTKLSIRSCRIDMYTNHELAKMLPLSSITNICLDGSFVPEGNYHILLDAKCVRLRNISLCRCQINDVVCKLIALKLCHPCPAEKSLLLLNLTSNHITDIGAKYLGEALRTNRCLRYLNLSDNHIGDDGAGYILDALQCFSLTYNENINKRKKHIEYLKKRHAVYLKYLNELYANRSNDEYSQNSKINSTKKKKGSTTSLKSKCSSRKETKKENLPLYLEDSKHRAEMIAGELVGPFRDPFSSGAVNPENGHCYCLGNMVLCYLNLSYNNLSYLSVNKLYNVLQYQSTVKKLNETGLMKVILDGNYMPVFCDEYNSIVEFLNKSLSNFGGKLFSEFGRRKSRTGTRISIVPERNIPKK